MRSIICAWPLEGTTSERVAMKSCIPMVDEESLAALKHHLSGRNLPRPDRFHLEYPASVFLFVQALTFSLSLAARLF